MVLADFHASLVFIFGLTFFVGMSYFFTKSSEVVIFHGYSIAGATMNKFSGALVGGSLGQLILYSAGKHPSPGSQIFWFSIFLLGCLVVIELLLAYVSGGIGNAPNKENVEMRMKGLSMFLGMAYAWLLQHMFGIVQGLAVFEVSPGSACDSVMKAGHEPCDSVEESFFKRFAGCSVGLLIVVSSFLFIWLVCKIKDAVWKKVSMWDDQQTDEYEWLWHKYSDVVEVNAACTTIGHLATQVLRLCIAGYLPKAGGEPDTKEAYWKWKTSWLFIVSIAGVLVLAFMNPDAGRITVNKKYPRLVKWVTQSLAVMVGFCLLNGWCQLTRFALGVTGLMGDLLNGLLVTTFGVALIFGSTYIPEYFDSIHIGVPEADVKTTINIIATMVAFSWKPGFGSAIKVITADAQFLPIPTQTFILTVFVLALVMPAWYNHVLPVLMGSPPQSTFPSKDTGYKLLLDSGSASQPSISLKALDQSLAEIEQHIERLEAQSPRTLVQWAGSTIKGPQ